MIIIVDAMGGDNAPHEIVKGCVEAVNEESGFEILLVGDKSRIDAELVKYTCDKGRISVHHATEKIENDDTPVKAIKSKKDSSMVVGLNLLKSRAGDAFLSAGNSGALMVGSLLILGRIKGVQRPALAPLIPTRTGVTLLIDGGSNSVCSPENLLQFAMMGTIYMKNYLGKENPTVGLVNNGTEEKKGNSTVRLAYELLCRTKSINFAGNVEGREIPEGAVDIVVCDGFVGNVILKVMEGMGKVISVILKEEFGRNVFTMLGALLLKRGFTNFKRKMDYREYGAAPFLGVDGVVMKSHGSSNAKAIKNAVKTTVKCVKSGVIRQMKEDFQNMEADELDTGE